MNQALVPFCVGATLRLAKLVIKRCAMALGA